MKLPNVFRCAIAIVAFSTLAPAAVILDKPADLGPYWHPLSATGTYAYANSFVFTGTSGTVADTLGVYMRLNEGEEGTGSPFRFELLADNGNAPDPANVLAVSGYQQYSGTTLQLVTGSLLVPYALTNGTRYWVSASTVGQQGGEAYQVGGHSQNSVYADNGTFWYSNDSSGMNFDGQSLTPEMAIYVAGGESAIPEPTASAMIAAGLGLLAFLRRRS